MQDFLKLIKKTDKIAIFSHENPDPDAIGSALALCKLLENAGKKVGLFCSGEMSEKYDFLRYYDKYNTESFENFDLFIAVDVASLEMLGKFGEIFSKNLNTIRLDHHTSGSNFAKINVCMPYSACALLIFEIANKLKLKITPEIATDLYFAVCGDTSIFHNNNTDSKTFLVCSKLLELGADPKFVYSEFFDKKTVPYVKLTSKCLLGAELEKNHDYAIMTASLDDYKECKAESTESIGNLLHTYLACGFKMVAILKETDDGIRCSLRSKAEYDCTVVAEIFGGGGHKNAAGCTISGNLDGAKKKLKKALKEYFK